MKTLQVLAFVALMSATATPSFAQEQAVVLLLRPVPAPITQGFPAQASPAQGLPVPVITAPALMVRELEPRPVRRPLLATFRQAA